MNVSTITNATDILELNDAVETLINETGCELDDSQTYEDSREWFAQDNANGDSRAVGILDAAIVRLHELVA